MFFVTAIKSHTKPTDKRTFGYFETYALANQSVCENYCDMHEYYYDYIVIEEIGVGIHPDVEKEWWYALSPPFGTWKKISEKPSWAMCTNWSLG